MAADSDSGAAAVAAAAAAAGAAAPGAVACAPPGAAWVGSSSGGAACARACACAQEARGHASPVVVSWAASTATACTRARTHTQTRASAHVGGCRRDGRQVGTAAAAGDYLCRRYRAPAERVQNMMLFVAVRVAFFGTLHYVVTSIYTRIYLHLNIGRYLPIQYTTWLPTYTYI